jgi:hypothetical protein
MERVMGIEPTSSAWKAEVLPLNYTRWFYSLSEPAFPKGVLEIGKSEAIPIQTALRV